MARPQSAGKGVSEGFALAGFPLLEFDRKPIDPFPLRGFALAWNAELTLIHVLNNDFFRLNGYAIFRNSDVKRWRSFPESDFLPRAAHLQKVRSSMPAAVTIDSMKEAISSAGASFPLITIRRERTNRGVCEVGKFLQATQRIITIRAISTQAEWEAEESYPLREITLLEFGGEYERLLWQMAKR
jgi:hypothetical protein